MGDNDTGIFLFVMARAARQWRAELDALLLHYGLTEARTRPLIYIDRLGDGIRQKDLAAELDIEGSSLVRLLDSLEKAKLIRRKVGKSDRRERKLYLTPDGQSLVTKVRTLTGALHRYVLSHVAEKDIEACMRTFDALSRALVNAADAVDSEHNLSDAAEVPSEPEPAKRPFRRARAQSAEIASPSSTTTP